MTCLVVSIFKIIMIIIIIVEIIIVVIIIIILIITIIISIIMIIVIVIVGFRLLLRKMKKHLSLWRSMRSGAVSSTRVLHS